MMKISKYLILLFFPFVLSCIQTEKQSCKSGVSIELAEYRKKKISDVTYNLFFDIQEEKSLPVNGNITINFNTAEYNTPLAIDFLSKPENIEQITCNTKKVKIKWENEHIIIPEKYLRIGSNEIYIKFIASDLSLNRNEKYLYTLFVPDRARTAFPCFDQPDLKARFNLKLRISKKWTAIANGKLIAKKEENGRLIIEFAQTKPLSTYLFSFVAGEFEEITQKHKNQEIRLFHREDGNKLTNNVDEIFDQIFKSLDWLEEYTTIPYPFAKYDLIAIPSFQYGGMEHAGATLYKSSSIFLDQNYTIKQELNRANLIAHETSHMWFGDLVTMKWFNDVWMKEVFANFMADKITKPDFPNINHKLKFLVSHYPEAYSVDRTQGANPIGQKLDNLNNAGTLYGAIIYHKSAIIMNKLEKLIGEENLKKGLQEYLKTFAYSNANWKDLISILEKFSEHNLEHWSNTWVNEPGMPKYTLSSGLSPVIQQSDPFNRKRTWGQTLNVLCKNDRSKLEFSVYCRDKITKLPDIREQYELTILNGKGDGYGYFELQESEIDYLGNNNFRSFNDVKPI